MHIKAIHPPCPSHKHQYHHIDCKASTGRLRVIPVDQERPRVGSNDSMGQIPQLQIVFASTGEFYSDPSTPKVGGLRACPSRSDGSNNRIRPE